MKRGLHSKASLKAALLPIIKQSMKRKGPGAWIGPLDLAHWLDEGHVAMLPEGVEISVEDGYRRYVVKAHGQGRATISRRFDANDPRAARLLEALGLAAIKVGDWTLPYKKSPGTRAAKVERIEDRIAYLSDGSSLHVSHAHACPESAVAK